MFQKITEQSATKYQKIWGDNIPKDLEKSKAFQVVAEYFKNNDDEQVTIPYLINMMKDCRHTAR